MGHADTHRRLHELAASQSFDELRGHLRENATFEDTARGIVTDSSAAFVDWLSGWFVAFSDARPADGQYLEGPDFSVALFRGKGTNDGPMGPNPPTGRSMDLPMCEVLRYGADGRVVSGKIYYDQLTMLTQLGLAPAPQQATAVGELEAVARERLAAFDRKDFAGLRASFTRDAQGVDEISRRWLRSDSAIDEYFRKLDPVVSDIRSELSDFSESVVGDTGLVTFWLDQEYTLEGQAHRISAPTTMVLRREDGEWRVALIHSVSLPEEP